MKYLAILALLILIGCAKRPVKNQPPLPPVLAAPQPKAIKPKKGDFVVNHCQPITGKEGSCICAHAVTHADAKDPGMTLECKQ